MYHRPLKDQRGDSGNSYVNQVLSVDLIFHTTIFQMVTDGLQFNITESVELYLSYQQTLKVKLLTWRSSKT